MGAQGSGLKRSPTAKPNQGKLQFYSGLIVTGFILFTAVTLAPLGLSMAMEAQIDLASVWILPFFKGLIQLLYYYVLFLFHNRTFTSASKITIKV